jgi:hypothetical protein
MRTITRTTVVYTAEELQQQHPRGFTRAHDTYAMREQEWQDTSDEWGSLKAFDERIGYRRDRYQDWDLTRGLGEASGFTGRRAWAWLENVVLADLRVPWSPITRYGWLSADRQKHARYQEWPGTVPSCPFTGFCVDEDILDSLRDSIRSGMTVGDAVRSLEDMVQRVIDADLEYRCSEEAFLEHAADNDLEFDETGAQV